MLNAQSRKREYKDKKYGFGGKKRGTRRNDATSYEDASKAGFSVGKSLAKDTGRNKSLDSDLRKRKAAGTKKRPGKKRRGNR